MAVHHIPTDVQADLKLAMLANYELIIRDMAGNVRSLCQSRRDHPSFGTTKGAIARAVHQMEGAIGAYMVLAGQANHPFIAMLAEFLSDETTELVRQARGEAIVMGVKI